MNEQGISFVETILAVAILFLITTTLIPMTHQMRTTIYTKKLELHASEVALNGALIVEQYGEQYGIQEIDNVLYHWIYAQNSICVQYENDNQTYEKCV